MRGPLDAKGSGRERLPGPGRRGIFRLREQCTATSKDEPKALETTNVLAVPIDLLMVDSSYTENNQMCGVLLLNDKYKYMASFTKHVLRFIMFCRYQHFISFYE